MAFALGLSCAFAPRRQRKTYEQGWWDGLKEAEKHFEERASVTLALAPEGKLSYSALRCLVFNQAVQDCAEIRRRIEAGRRAP